MIIRGKAPLRISFCGGGTDISPYKDEQGGVVLSATINKYTYGSLQPCKGNSIVVHSLDYNIVAEYLTSEDLQYDGQLDLVKAVLKAVCKKQGEGAQFFIHSDTPPSSGLGSSSTLVVTLIGLLKHWQQLTLTRYEIAELAYAIERLELGNKGGVQDQYAAAFGGFNFIEFGQKTVTVNPVPIASDVLHELEYNLLLCYIGGTRLSDRIIDTQINNYVCGGIDVLTAMQELKDITLEMKKTLLQKRVDDFGTLLHDAWLNKKKMAAQITNAQIDELYEIARAYGALGGKILGAGGGGYLLLYCRFNKKFKIAAELEKRNGRIVDFAFTRGGLQTWEANS
ncbi:MAG: hypothetical protein R3A44_05750 [Caldilineaceae bacterium]